MAYEEARPPGTRHSYAAASPALPTPALRLAQHRARSLDVLGGAPPAHNRIRRPPTVQGGATSSHDDFVFLSPSKPPSAHVHVHAHHDYDDDAPATTETRSFLPQPSRRTRSSRSVGKCVTGMAI